MGTAASAGAASIPDRPARPIASRLVRSVTLAQRPECCPKLGAEELRLLPRGEVPALVDLVEVDQVGIGAPGPRLRGSIDVLRKDGDGRGERDLCRLLRSRTGRATSVVLPIQPR